MSTSKDSLISLLREKKGDYLSGEAAAAALGISRAAVSKQIAVLRSEGWEIESRTNRGYFLKAEGPLLSESGIREGLTAEILGRDIEIFPSVGSTNRLAKERAAGGAREGLVLFAEEQTAGRGRLGRSFTSPKGTGLYMTVLLRPDLPFEKIPHLTLLAAVAAAEAVEKLSGLSPEIKWVNDLLYQGRKLAGILTEAGIESETGRISYAAVGIGINVNPNPALSPDERNFPASVGDFVKAPSRNALAAEILNQLEKYYRMELAGDTGEILRQYRKRLSLLGQKVTVLAGDGSSYPAKAVGLDDKGALLVEKEDGSTAALTSGEISVRAYSPLQQS